MSEDTLVHCHSQVLSLSGKEWFQFKYYFNAPSATMEINIRHWPRSMQQISQRLPTAQELATQREFIVTDIMVGATCDPMVFFSDSEDNCSIDKMAV